MLMYSRPDKLPLLPVLSEENLKALLDLSVGAPHRARFGNSGCFIATCRLLKCIGYARITIPILFLDAIQTAKQATEDMLAIGSRLRHEAEQLKLESTA